MIASTGKADLPWTRWVLAAAAAIAIVAVGVSLLGRKSPEAPPAAAPQAAPDVNAMIGKLEARLKEDPSSGEGWRLLGWSYFETGHYPDAARAYRRAAELNPRQAELWSALGESLVLARGAGVSDEALTAFKTALTIDPKDSRARFFVGARKAEHGDARAAIADWLALLKDSPADAPWAGSVRQRLQEVAAASKIDIADRLAALPAPAPSATDVARTSGIPGR